MDLGEDFWKSVDKELSNVRTKARDDPLRLGRYVAFIILTAHFLFTSITPATFQRSWRQTKMNIQGTSQRPSTSHQLSPLPPAMAGRWQLITSLMALSELINLCTPSSPTPLLKLPDFPPSILRFTSILISNINLAIIAARKILTYITLTSPIYIPMFIFAYTKLPAIHQ